LVASWCAAGGDEKLIKAGIDPEQLMVRGFEEVARAMGGREP
jgi:hypothetical protein